MTEKDMLFQNEVLSMPPQETGFEGLYLGHNFWNTHSESLSDLNRFRELNGRDAERTIESHIQGYDARRKLLTGCELQRPAHEVFDMSSECNISRNINATRQAVLQNLFNRAA